MELDEKTLSYFLYKGLNAIIFSENFDSEFDIVTSTVDIHTYGSIVALQYLVENYRDILDDNMKDNIYKLVNYYRYNLEFHNEEIHNNSIEIFNNIISTINRKTTNDYSEFVKEELKVRGVCKTKYKPTIEEEFRKIKKYNIMDYLVLCLLLDILPEEENKLLIKTFSSYELSFIYSINCIMEEWPALLLDESCIDKINSVTSLLLKEIDSLDKKEIKTVLKKEYKTYNKRLTKLYSKKEYV